ncbi:Deoxythymidylate kinase [Cystobasidium minutum MCA 4210]|uniref:Deoxythymidylate kinase n=1 Tax=Cystobasidium minutum MCA 4210 TaxID=1397322 RepID=UPI0034CD7ADC|eukprot:jgi/Rhomi1/146939/e_gw1.7.355.1
MAPTTARRGAFIILEGLDRSGKSTQCLKLVDNLNAAGLKSKSMRFPDRTTTTGKMIDAYLKQDTELDDHAIHLLFAVNRWEKAKMIQHELEAGTNIVCDRYAFSGAAFSAAKVSIKPFTNDPSSFYYTWCKSPDIGLPAPDLVIFLSVSAEVASSRGGFGEERYEKNEIQEKVRELFRRLGSDVGSQTWKEIDAGGSIEDVEGQISKLAVEVCRNDALGDVKKLWL